MVHSYPIPVFALGSRPCPAFAFVPHPCGRCSARPGHPPCTGHARVRALCHLGRPDLATARARARGICRGREIRRGRGLWCLG